MPGLVRRLRLGPLATEPPPFGDSDDNLDDDDWQVFPLPADVEAGKLPAHLTDDKPEGQPKGMNAFVRLLATLAVLVAVVDFGSDCGVLFFLTGPSPVFSMLCGLILYLTVRFQVVASLFVGDAILGWHAKDSDGQNYFAALRVDPSDLGTVCRLAVPGYAYVMLWQRTKGADASKSRPGEPLAAGKASDADAEAAKGDDADKTAGDGGEQGSNGAAVVPAGRKIISGLLELTLIPFVCLFAAMPMLILHVIASIMHIWHDDDDGPGSFWSYSDRERRFAAIALAWPVAAACTEAVPMLLLQGLVLAMGDSEVPPALLQVSLATSAITALKALVLVTAYKTPLMLTLRRMAGLSTDDDLAVLAAQNPTFRTLELTMCDRVTLEPLTTPWPRLRKLKLTLCDSITNKGLETLLQQAPAIGELYLEACGTGMNRLNTNANNLLTLKLVQPTPLPILRVLTIKECSQVKTKHVARLVAQCPNLQECLFEGSRDFERGTMTSRGLLVALEQSCPKLKKLIFRDWPVYESDIVEPLKFPGLEDLQMHGVRMAKSPFTALVRRCEKLSIAYAKFVSDYGSNEEDEDRQRQEQWLARKSGEADLARGSFVSTQQPLNPWDDDLAPARAGSNWKKIGGKTAGVSAAARVLAEAGKQQSKSDVNQVASNAQNDALAAALSAANDAVAAGGDSSDDAPPPPAPVDDSD